MPSKLPIIQIILIADKIELLIYICYQLLTIMKNANKKLNELNIAIASYLPQNSINKSNSQGLFRDHTKKNQLLGNSNQNQEIKEKKSKIMRELGEQRAHFKKNRERLSLKIDEYYKKISQKLQSQKIEVENSLTAEFSKTIQMFEQQQNKINEAYKQLISKKIHKNIESYLGKFATIEIPIIAFHEAQLESIDFIIETLHPLVQFAATETDSVFGKRDKIGKKIMGDSFMKPPFAYIGSAETENCKENRQIVQTEMNPFKKNLGLVEDSEEYVKTAVKCREEDYSCEEEVIDWKYETLRIKKGVQVDEIIAEESESKESSYLSQQIS